MSLAFNFVCWQNVCHIFYTGSCLANVIEFCGAVVFFPVFHCFPTKWWLQFFKPRSGSSSSGYDINLKQLFGRIENLIESFFKLFLYNLLGRMFATWSHVLNSSQLEGQISLALATCKLSPQETFQVNKMSHFLRSSKSRNRCEY